MKKIIFFIIMFYISITTVFADENYVTMIKIDDVDYSEFDINKTDYEIKVNSDKTMIKIVYIYNRDIYDNNGSNGELQLKYGENLFSFTLTNKENNELTKTYHFKVIREDNRSSDNSLSNLMVNSNKVILDEKLEYTVSVDGKLTSVEIKATPAYKATLVDGYGERIGNNALKLTGEITPVEIKVKAENETIRTYKINVKKSNYQSNDATLKSLKIDNIDFEFKSNILEYDLSVKNEVKNIKIEAISNDKGASVVYKKEYDLKEGINNIEISVIAEDQTEKIYKLNITREEEIPLVTDIKIKDVDFKFDVNKYSYKIKTELDKLEFDVTLSNEETTYEIENNENLNNNSIIKIIVKNNEKEATYSFKINKEEIKEKEVEKDKNIVLDTNISKSSNMFKDNEMIISLVIFGIGVLGLLFAIIVKSKSKVM